MVMLRFIIFIFVFFSTFFGFILILEYNKLQNLLQKVKSRKSNVETILSQKIDLVNQAILIAQDYSVHEKLIFLDTSQNFSQAYKSTENTSVLLKNLLVTYPDLKANTIYLDLMNNITRIEYDILDRKDKYNYSVEAYNATRLTFPINLFIQIFGFKEISYLHTY